MRVCQKVKLAGLHLLAHPLLRSDLSVPRTVLQRLLPSTRYWATSRQKTIIAVMFFNKSLKIKVPLLRYSIKLKNYAKDAKTLFINHWNTSLMQPYG